MSAGVHAVVAQGFEAGGHRGMFDPDAEDSQLGTIALTRLLVRELEVPVIAAGGIMDGAGIAAVLRLGAGAAQLGTAFVATDKSAADDGYRASLAQRGRPSHGDDARHLRTPGALPGKSLHRVRRRHGARGYSRLTRSPMTPAKFCMRRQGYWRVRLRRPMGRTGSTSGALPVCWKIDGGPDCGKRRPSRLRTTALGLLACAITIWHAYGRVTSKEKSV